MTRAGQVEKGTSMQTFGRGLATAVLLAGIIATTTHAETASDRPAAILVFPRVTAGGFGTTIPMSGTETLGTDTFLQISNTSTQPVQLHCFYVDAAGVCSVSGADCVSTLDASTCPLAQDLCIPTWIETDFTVYLTPRQPLAWRASQGLSGNQFPLDGIATRGPSGDSNAGSAIPPVRVHALTPAPPFNQSIEVWQGELKCVVVDATGRGIASNVVKGEATVESSAHLEGLTMGEVINSSTIERYNAVGIPAIDGDANGDGVLELGGDAGEYDGCANILIADFFFDDAGGGFSHGGPVNSEYLTLVPCSQDLRAQIPGSTTVQFLVFNEFEQRFSTSTPVNCYFAKQLTSIDTSDSSRSIFDAAVSGTVVGQTRIRGVNGGLIGVLSDDAEIIFAGSAAENLHQQGIRANADRIVLP